MRDHSHSSSTLDDLARRGQLLEEYRPKLLAMVSRRLDPALARHIDPGDVLGEAFLRARQRWADFKQGTMAACPWLYRLALDCLIEAWRRVFPRRDL